MNLSRVIREALLEVAAYKHQGQYVVRNLKSGTIYQVKTFDPAKHGKLEKDEIAAWISGKKGKVVAKKQKAKQKFVPSDKQKELALKAFQAGNVPQTTPKPTAQKPKDKKKAEAVVSALSISRSTDLDERKEAFASTRKLPSLRQTFLRKTAELPTEEMELLTNAVNSSTSRLSNPKVFNQFTGEDYEFEGYHLSKMVREIFHPQMPSDFRTHKTKLSYKRDPSLPGAKAFKASAGKKITEKDKKTLKRVMDLNQKALRESGVVNDDDTITVFRGLQVGGETELGERMDVEYPGSPADSWSFDPDVARKFLDDDATSGLAPVGELKGRVLKARIPLSKVVSSYIGDPNSFEYGLKEFECVVDSIDLDGVEMFSENIDNQELLREKGDEITEQKKKRIIVNINNNANIDWIRKLDHEE